MNLIFDGGFEIHHSDGFFWPISGAVAAKIGLQSGPGVRWRGAWILPLGGCLLLTLTDQLPDGHRQRRNKFINILSNFDQLLISWFQAISIDFHLSVAYISCRMVHDELWVVMLLPCLPRVQCNVSGKFESWSGKRAACLSLCKFWEVQKLRPGTNSDLKVPEFVVLQCSIVRQFGDYFDSEKISGSKSLGWSCDCYDDSIDDFG